MKHGKTERLDGHFATFLVAGSEMTGTLVELAQKEEIAIEEWGTVMGEDIQLISALPLAEWKTLHAWMRVTEMPAEASSTKFQLLLNRVQNWFRKFFSYPTPVKELPIGDRSLDEEVDWAERFKFHRDCYRKHASRM